MNLYVISHNDKGAALGLEQGERVGLRLSQIKLDALLCGPIHSYAATVDCILKYQNGLENAEILRDLDDTDGDLTEGRKRARRVTDYLLSRFKEQENVAIVTSAYSLGNLLFPAFMKFPDGDIDKCVGFGCDNASIGCIDLCEGKGSRCIFLNDTAHLCIPDKKDVPNIEIPQFPWE